MPLPTKAKEPTQPWRQSKVYVTRLDGVMQVPQVVEAEILGNLFVFWSDGYKRWGVGTVPTGLVVARLKEQSDAKRVAELLMRDVQEWKERDPDRLKHLLPFWVKHWCLKLTGSGEWSEPDKEAR